MRRFTRLTNQNAEAALRGIVNLSNFKSREADGIAARMVKSAGFQPGANATLERRALWQPGTTCTSRTIC
jgi:predicted Zn-dependent protease